MLKIVTWNVNSVRIRLHIIKQLVEDANPDIICLQETKVEDGLFPHDGIKALGFKYIYATGQKSYNGVAILSKIPLDIADPMFLADSMDKRHIAAVLPNGAVLHNFYVPAGGDIPDPKENPKFDFKLRFVDAMTDWSLAQPKKDSHMIIVGDFNIAPLPNDVWSHKQMLGVVSHTPVEVDALNGLQKSLDWVDAVRHFHKEDEKLYSWWSYRARDWAESNRGRRLDHIWVTPSLKSTLASTRIVKDARGWESPSDHVPVMIELNL